ncbi:hypothetical protein SBRCBS47491_000633 [Sporothrix bragantina]|uniref:FAD-binding PCMH-type domain-containing protein n=1 Tax=Sporothrix bragantina TaxID=671064 RepID=A0ABP0ARZ5_9PEZI
MATRRPFSLALHDNENKLADAVMDKWIATAAADPNAEVRPPGLDEAAWKTVLSEFRAILGADGVLVGGDQAGRYADPYAEFAPAEEREKRASAATLFPVTVEHIQGVLRVCNAHGVPLWTVSRGRNLGYGGPTARVKGSVIIDLQRMNRVLEVNDHFAYYTVEPGVTFFELYRAIQEQKKNVWMSCPALGWGSVVGNALDRGWGYTPAGDHSNHICGIEVVLADGTLVRTGMGAVDGSPCWPLFRGGFGPSYEGMFSQSNFGIVTKLSLWATPSPEGFITCNVEVESEDGLAPMLDAFRDLLLHDAIQNHPLIGNLPRKMVESKPRSEWYSGPGAVPDNRLREIQKELGCGYWSARWALYGPREIVDANLKRCEAAFSCVPGARMTSKAYFPPAGKRYLSPTDMPLEARTLETGTPSLKVLKAVEYKSLDGGHLGFSPVLPPDGKLAQAFYDEAKALCVEHGFDYFGGLHLYPRHLIMITMIFFDRQSAEDRRQAGVVFRRLVAMARKYGYSEYRAHVDYMDLVADQFDFNGGSLRKLNERIKDVLDPNGILSPGKQGIWPAAYRVKTKEASTAATDGANGINGVNGDSEPKEASK